MCFVNEYSCKIYCLNTELNLSAAMNRSIEGVHQAGDCRVVFGIAIICVLICILVLAGFFFIRTAKNDPTPDDLKRDH